MLSIWGLLAVFPPSLGAAEAPDRLTLTQAVEATGLPVRLADGRLTGPGADRLHQRAREAAVVVVGENHGIAQVPEVVGALWRDLHPWGFDHLVIETGPVTAEELERMLAAGPGALEGDGELAGLLARHPLAVPFYGWREEAELLVQVLTGAEGSGGPVLWGIDQEFVMAPPWHLEALGRWAEKMGGEAGERAKAAVRELQGRPMPPGAPIQAHPLALTSLETEDLVVLERAFGDDPPPEARRLLRELRESHQIYRLFMAGDNYGSNQTRAELLRRNLLHHYRRAEARGGEPPRFLAKVGLAHAYRGRTPNNAFDIGNLALALGDEQGRESFHLAVVCGPGSRSAGFGPSPESPCTSPFPTLAGSADGWRVYDLAAVRADLHMGRLTVDEPSLESLVWNLDAALVMPGAGPAGLLVVPSAP